MSEPDDERLVRHLRAGHPEACAELVRAHYRSVYRFLVHLTRHVHQAEDLTQETFAAAWEQITGFQGRARLATWLHRIAYTKFIDAERRQRRAADVLGRHASASIAPADPFDTVATDDETRRLYRALHRLNGSEHTLIVLHYFQGLSYREMSSVLDEPSGTLKWRTSAALVRLRSMLSDEVPIHASRKSS